MRLTRFYVRRSSGAFVGPYCVQRLLRQQLRPEIAQPVGFVEAVAGHGLDAAVFAVGVGVVDGAVDEVVQAGEDAQGTG
jgi:hypothetical protein